jgi:hypothetical protein
LIWGALVLYSLDSLRAYQSTAAADRAAPAGVQQAVTCSEV